MINRREVIKGTCAAALFGFTPVCAGGKKSSDNKKVAMYWHHMAEFVECELCPHKCILGEAKTGICRTRQNIGGNLITHAYANPCAVHVDPIEKKPLYHFLPGIKTFSIATAGCNLRCKNCQNYSISQASPLETTNEFLMPADVVEKALQSGCKSIAYTYSEPIVWYEYMIDTAKLARKAGLKNLWITAGFINEPPILELAQYIDAANIDLKSYDNSIYMKLNGGRLEPILKCLKTARNAGMWVEITNLVIPDWTDNLEMIRNMCRWIVQNMGEDIPLHFSRFFPVYKLAHLHPTPHQTLSQAQKIALETGLRYVYIGNVPAFDSSTYCPGCRTILVERNGYVVKKNLIDKGRCPQCKIEIAGIWSC